MGTNHTISYRAYYKTGGAWAAFPGLIKVSPIRVESGTGVGPFQFGGATLPQMGLETTLAGPTSGWLRAPVYAEIRVDVDGVEGDWETAFSGILLRKKPKPDATGYAFTAGSQDRRIPRTRVQTPLRYRRPLATKTSLTSVEDPDSASYRGGLFNEVCWKARGRPHEQSVTYPDAEWYYSCDPTSVAPEWSWVDGEDAWSELLALAEASGGQIYVDSFGVVRYVNPLKLAEEVGGAPVVADTGPHAAGRVLYTGEVQEEVDLEAAYNVAVCRFQRRSLQPPQEVYNSPYPCPPLQPSATHSLTLATQWPIRWRDEDGAVEYTVTVHAVDYAQGPVAVTATVTAENAQSLEVTLTNPIAQRVSVTRIIVEGRPVTVVHEGEARHTGARFDANDAEDVERRLEDSIYTQSQGAAERRARLAVLFDGNPRAVYRGLRCPYAAGVTVGGYVRFYSARLGISDLPCRIIGKTVEESGRDMVLDLASVEGLRKLSEYWIVGQTYADSDERRLGL